MKSLETYEIYLKGQGQVPHILQIIINIKFEEKILKST